MPDEPIPDPPANTPSGDGETAGEDDLDSLLAAATALAGDVTEDVGVPDDPPASSQPGPLAEEVGEVAADLDAQLAQLDTLLEETGQEIGTQSVTTAATETSTADVETDREPVDVTDAGTSAPSSALPEDLPADIDSQLEALDGLLDDAGAEADTAPAGASSESSSEPEDTPAGAAPAIPEFMAEFTDAGEETDAPPDAVEPQDAAQESPAVPDFMAEFTSAEPGTEDVDRDAPEAQQSSSPAPAGADEPGSSPAPKPGVVSSRDRGVVKSEGMPSAMGELTLDDVDGIADLDEPAPAAPPVAPRTRRVPGVVRRMVAPLSPIAFKACECGVGMLEAIDKPSARLGDWPRRIIGLVAIATLGASLIVYVGGLF